MTMDTNATPEIVQEALALVAQMTADERRAFLAELSMQLATYLAQDKTLTDAQ